MFGFRWFKKYKIVRIETEVVQVEDEIIQIEGLKIQDEIIQIEDLKAQDEIIQIEEKEPIVYLPIKDRNDRNKCESSTNWENESYCPYCFNETNHDERMADVCLSCGTHDANLSRKKRVTRKIWSGKSWLIQRSYRNKLFIAGEEWRYEKGFKYSYSYEGPKVWRLRTFEDVSKHEYSKPIEVLDDEYLFIYKKELIEEE